MPVKIKNEILAALARYVKESSEPYSILARRLNVSVSTLRRAAATFGITRRPRLGRCVLEKIEEAREKEAR
jgi:hypothetical protein